MTERVLVTGGAGTLGRALARLLPGHGYTVRLFDLGFDPLPDGEGVELWHGDLRDRRDVERAVDGVDAVVHGAAWHGIHLREHPAADFWELNVDSTFLVYEAAAAARIDKVVLSSTMGVYGESRRPGADGRAVRIHESLPCLPGDVYGLSKVLDEEMAAYYARAHGIGGTALRFGMFVPEPFLHYGIRMLYGGVDERDAAEAVRLSLEKLRGGPGFAAYNVMSAVPYREHDAADLRADPLAVLARHWPDAPALLEHAGATLWGPVNEWFSIEKAERDLGWQPRYGFAEFLAALRAGIESADAVPPAA